MKESRCCWVKNRSYLSDLRIKKGYTQVQLAETIDVSPQKIYSIERYGIKSTTVWIALAYCKILGITIEEAVKGQGERIC